MKKYIITILLTIFLSPPFVSASVLYSQTIPLSPGWNIISTPKVLDSHTFSADETSNNFDIYALDASKISGWSTLADLNQTEFTPLYGYFINNKTGVNQTLIFNYKDVSIPEQFFSRTFTSPGWYSFGIANSSYAKDVDDDNTDIDNPDDILQSLIGETVHYGDVTDLTDANSNIKSVAVSDPFKDVIRSADISDNTQINALKDFRESKGYAIYIKDSNVTYSGLQNKTIPLCSDGIDNDGDGVIDMNDIGCNSTLDNNETDPDDGGQLTPSVNSPSGTMVKVDEDNTTDDVLVFAFNLDVNDDSSDITLKSLPVTLSFNNNNTLGLGTNWANKIVRSAMLNINGYEYGANLTSDNTSSGSGSAVYTVNLNDENVILEGGDIDEIKVYITIDKQDSNYDENTTIQASVDGAMIDAETYLKNSGLFGTTSRSGGLISLSLSPALVTGVTSSVSKDSDSKVGTYEFQFKVEADGSDITLNTAALDYDIIGGAATASFSIVKNSGTVMTGYTAGSEYVVEDGNNATFTATYTINPGSGQSGTYYVTLNSIAGVTVDKTTTGLALVE